MAKTGLVVSIVAAILILVISSVTVAYINKQNSRCPPTDSKQKHEQTFLLAINGVAIGLSALLLVLGALAATDKHYYGGAGAARLRSLMA